MPLLVLLFIALPIAELYVIVQVAQGIGILPTLALLLLDGFLGAALARSQGRAAWARFNRALAEGRVPARETFDGAMIILGGALLLTPGFLTDVLGLALLIPPTRALLRGLVARMAKRRATLGWTVVSAPPRGGPRPGFGQRPGGFDPRPGGFGRRPRYDYEGSAREVSDPAAELPKRHEDD